MGGFDAAVGAPAGERWSPQTPMRSWTQDVHRSRRVGKPHHASSCLLARAAIDCIRGPIGDRDGLAVGQSVGLTPWWWV